VTIDLAQLRAVRGRLAAGEPIRILIGHTLHSASEIQPAGAFAAGLRAAFLADIEARIAALTPPDPPATPAAAIERTA
jgi:hypothetical protein